MKMSLLPFSFQLERLTGKMNADTLCRIAKDNGIESLDLMTSEIMLYGARELIRAFDKTGVYCGCVIADLPFYQGTGAFPKKLEKALEKCEKLGAKSLMIVPGSADEIACAGMSREEMLNRAVEMYSSAVTRAREKGIEVLFEDTPQPHKPLSTAADCRRVLDAVPELGFACDTANFLVSEEHCDILANFDLLSDRIRRIHIKDAVRGKFPSGEKCSNGDRIRCVAVGAGCAEVKALLKKLGACGYDGALCIEYSAGSGVHGLEHIKYLSLYVSNVRSYLSGDIICPPYGEIAGVNKPVSRIFFGTAIAPMLAGKDVNALLDAAFSVGINAFDCARGYGLAERSLGRWIHDRNNREKVVILSKCGNVNSLGRVKIDRSVIISELNASLKSLNTDYIDVYLLHRDDRNTPVSEYIDTLNELKRARRIRAFGVSNWTIDRIEEANAYARQAGLEGFALSSPNFGLARQMCDPWGGDCVTVAGPENKGVRERYAISRMPVLAYSSLGRGFFSGKFRSGDYENAEKILDAPSRKGYLCDENMKRLMNAETLAEKYNTTVPDIAMRYVFGSDMNIFAVISSTNPARLPGNVKAANNPLSSEDISFLENDVNS